MDNDVQLELSIFTLTVFFIILPFALILLVFYRLLRWMCDFCDLPQEISDPVKQADRDIERVLRRYRIFVFFEKTVMLPFQTIKVFSAIIAKYPTLKAIVSLIILAFFIIAFITNTSLICRLNPQLDCTVKAEESDLTLTPIPTITPFSTFTPTPVPTQTQTPPTFNFSKPMDREHYQTNIYCSDSELSVFSPLPNHTIAELDIKDQTLPLVGVVKHNPSQPYIIVRVPTTMITTDLDTTALSYCFLRVRSSYFGTSWLTVTENLPTLEG